MNRVIMLAAACAAVAIAPTAHADTTAPTPYQIGPDSQLPGNQVYQPVCGQYPPACGLHFDIGTQTWQRATS